MRYRIYPEKEKNSDNYKDYQSPPIIAMAFVYETDALFATYAYSRKVGNEKSTLKLCACKPFADVNGTFREKEGAAA